MRTLGRLVILVTDTTPRSPSPGQAGQGRRSSAPSAAHLRLPEQPLGGRGCCRRKRRRSAIEGDQTGGQPVGVFYTSDTRRDHARFAAQGVRFTREPVEDAVVVYAHFIDLYGNELYCATWSRAAHAKEPAMDLQLKANACSSRARPGIGLAGGAGLRPRRRQSWSAGAAARPPTRSPPRPACRRLRGAGPGTRRRARNCARQAVDILVNNAGAVPAAHWIRCGTSERWLAGWEPKCTLYPAGAPVLPADARGRRRRDRQRDRAQPRWWPVQSASRPGRSRMSVKTRATPTERSASARYGPGRPDCSRTPWRRRHAGGGAGDGVLDHRAAARIRAQRLGRRQVHIRKGLLRGIS